MKYPITISQLRNDDYSLTDLAIAFGLEAQDKINDLFNKGIYKGLSAQDVNTIISYLLFEKYGDYIYDREIDFL